jgi:hypothetical protein
MPGRCNQTKPGLPSGCQVNIKCFYAKSACLGSNYRNISSLTLVQKVIPGYLQRTVDNYSLAYLWLISHDLSHGVPLKLHIYYPIPLACSFKGYDQLRGSTRAELQFEISATGYTWVSHADSGFEPVTS